MDGLVFQLKAKKGYSDAELGRNIKAGEAFSALQDRAIKLINAGVVEVIGIGDDDMALSELSRQQIIQARQAAMSPPVEPTQQPQPEPIYEPEEPETEQGFETDLTASIGTAPARGRPKK